MANALNDAEFQSKVVESSKPVLVDFWAEWCAPCRMVGPVIEELGKEYNGKADVYKMDVDANAEIPQKFNIFSIPTVLVFKGGEVVEQFVGVQSITTYRAALDKYL